MGLSHMWTPPSGGPPEATRSAGGASRVPGMGNGLGG